jgi:hypothetical protein
MQEMETMNVGIRRNLTPFTYENVSDAAVKDIIQ